MSQRPAKTPQDTEAAVREKPKPATTDTAAKTAKTKTTDPTPRS